MKKVIGLISMIALCTVSLTACIQVVSPTSQPQETAATQPPVQQTVPATVPMQVPQTQPAQVPQTQPVIPQVPMQGGYQLPQFAITVDQAKAIVLNASGFSEANVTFTKQKQDYDDGMPEYEIEFVANNMKYEFEVNGVTGAITKQEIDTIFD